MKQIGIFLLLAALISIAAGLGLTELTLGRKTSP